VFRLVDDLTEQFFSGLLLTPSMEAVQLKRSTVAGMPTPHDNEGSFARKSMRWLSETEGWKASAVTSRIEDDFRERTQWQLGKTRDPSVYLALATY